MLVKNWMSSNLITIDVNESMQDAMRILKENDIRMLPVMKKGKLVGVVTDRDVKRASASDATTLEIHELLYLVSKIKVEEIMSRKPVTVPFDYTVEECAEILLSNKISGAPVVDKEGKIVGMITQTDLFKVILSLTGLRKRGVSFGLVLDDIPGSIKGIADIIRNYGGRIASILSSYERVPEGKRKVYIRMYSIDRTRLPGLESDLKGKAALLYMVDHREDVRKIYS